MQTRVRRLESLEQALTNANAATTVASQTAVEHGSVYFDLNALDGVVEDSMMILVDGGAVASVCPIDHAPEAATRDVAQKTKFRAANGAKVDHIGEKMVDCASGDGNILIEHQVVHEKMPIQANKGIQENKVIQTRRISRGGGAGDDPAPPWREREGEKPPPLPPWRQGQGAVIPPSKRARTGPSRPGEGEATTPPSRQCGCDCARDVDPEGDYDSSEVIQTPDGRSVRIVCCACRACPGVGRCRSMIEQTSEHTPTMCWACLDSTRTIRRDGREPASSLDRKGHSRGRRPGTPSCLEAAAAAAPSAAQTQTPAGVMSRLR